MDPEIAQIRQCKRCLLYEMADKAAYESVKSFIDSIPEQERTEDAEYNRRLQLCKACDYLLSGMCRRCGCYVEVRASGRSSHCPGNIW